MIVQDVVQIAISIDLFLLLVVSTGGKRALDSYAEYDKNPCFCHDGAYCMDASTGSLTTSMFLIQCSHY